MGEYPAVFSHFLLLSLNHSQLPGIEQIYFPLLKFRIKKYHHVLLILLSIYTS